jgi:hypothetical protein
MAGAGAGLGSDQRLDQVGLGRVGPNHPFQARFMKSGDKVDLFSIAAGFLPMFNQLHNTYIGRTEG